MELQAAVIAQAFSDSEDRLLNADEPLAALQRSCGGDLPGIIAVPELLEIVRKARQFGLPIAQTIAANDGADTVRAWVEIEPIKADDDHANGCRIVIRSWHSTPLALDDAHVLLCRRTAMDREVAELSARLDAAQRILTVTSDSADLQELVTAMAAGGGRPFTDFLAPEGTGNQALHWRMLDGAPVRVTGSDRAWRIVLVPQIQHGLEPRGFELLLVSDLSPPKGVLEWGDKTPPSTHSNIIGSDLAPVLRQPIARIVANAETISARLAGPLPDAYADYAAEIANAGRLLLGLLEDLSDLEFVESDSFSTAPDQIDLGEVARQAAGILNVRAQEKNIVVDAPQQGEHLYAIAEFRRVLQVLINLIGNAIRYAPSGSHIWVRLLDEVDRAKVIVADQGPGLSGADQEIIFEKFERLGRCGDGGSGLGLYISRRLARAMGGDLTVESAEGQGARFILDLPADVRRAENN